MPSGPQASGSLSCGAVLMLVSTDSPPRCAASQDCGSFLRLPPRKGLSVTTVPDWESGQHSLVWERRPWTGSGAWVPSQALSSRSLRTWAGQCPRPGLLHGMAQGCSSLVTCRPELQLLLKDDWGRRWDVRLTRLLALGLAGPFPGTAVGEAGALASCAVARQRHLL